MFFAGITTKFNQRMYAKMRGKKNDPISSIKKRTVRVIEKGVFVIPPASITEPSRMASSVTLVEEITPLRKKTHVEGQGEGQGWFSFILRFLRCWRGHKRFLLLRSWRSSQAYPLTRLWVVISTNSSRYCNYAISPFLFLSSFAPFWMLDFLFRCWGRVFTLL